MGKIIILLYTICTRDSSLVIFTGLLAFATYNIFYRTDQSCKRAEILDPNQKM